MSITIVVDIAKSPRVTLSLDKALQLVNIIKKHVITKDLEEAERVLRNFREYYDRSRRRFEEYISLTKDVADIIKGKVVVQKLRLMIKEGNEYVELIFDRRISVDFLRNCLKETGFLNIDVIDQSRS